MIASRLAVYYGVIFFIIGVMLPFWPLWMQARGLSPEDIGIVTGVGMLMKVIANPVIASYADQTGTRRRLLILLSIIAVVTFGIFWSAHSFWSILIVTMGFFFFWSPLMPLTETLTMHYDTAGTVDYGRVRLWGSLTFIAAAVGGGWVLTGRGEDMIYWILLGGMATLALVAAILPDPRLSPPYQKRSLSPFLRILKDRTFLWFIVATSLIQTSHIIYYVFGTIHWQKVGHSEAVIGWLWAEGVMAEVILFIWGAKIAQKVGPAGLISLAGFAGMIRWCGTGLTDALPALLALQTLHGATFGAAHLGAVYFIAQRMDSSISATAQGVYAAAVSGIGFSLASLLSGYLYAEHGRAAYISMALLAGLGALIGFQLRKIKHPPDAP